MRREFRTTATITSAETGETYEASRNAITPAAAGGLLATTLLHAKPGDTLMLTCEVIDPDAERRARVEDCDA